MKRLTKEEFVEKSRKIYGDKYDYSKVEYKNVNTKVCIICPIHGEFEQRPDHFFNGHGCPKCGNQSAGDKLRKSRDEFIQKAKEVHGDKYDYSKVEYIKAKKKVCIICPIHGEFWQTPDAHLNGSKCPKCTHRSYNYTTDEFIQKAKEVHGDKYDYSKVEYINRLTQVCIICPIHGEFWQKPREHFKGKGCQKCHESVLEKKIKTLLEKNKIDFEPQKRFSWLKNKNPMSLDFYLPQYNVGIECQGEQHFKNREFFNKNQTFEERLEMDSLKKKLCNENNIKLLYFSSKYNVPKDWDKYDVICNEKKLLKEIINVQEKCIHS
jgi:hypothetical protein